MWGINKTHVKMKTQHVKCPKPAFQFHWVINPM